MRLLKAPIDSGQLAGAGYIRHVGEADSRNIVDIARESVDILSDGPAVLSADLNHGGCHAGGPHRHDDRTNPSSRERVIIASRARRASPARRCGASSLDGREVHRLPRACSYTWCFGTTVISAARSGVIHVWGSTDATDARRSGNSLAPRVASRAAAPRQGLVVPQPSCHGSERPGQLESFVEHH